MSERIKTPVRQGSKPTDHHSFYNSDGEWLGRCGWDKDTAEIVSALNSHAALREACEAALQRADAAEAKLAAVREALVDGFKIAEEERFKELDDAQAESAKWKAEGDMYGWNFYQGIASGTTGASFIFHRVRDRVLKLFDTK